MKIQDNFQGKNVPDQDMTGGLYTQSDSAGDSNDMVQMPIGVY